MNKGLESRTQEIPEKICVKRDVKSKDCRQEEWKVSKIWKRVTF